LNDIITTIGLLQARQILKIFFACKEAVTHWCHERRTLNRAWQRKL